MHNLFRYENTLRVTLGIILLLFASWSQEWFWLLPALLLIYTGAHSFCPIYATLGVNRKQAQETYHLAQLPKYNPEPILIYSIKGELKYKNPNVTQELLDAIHIQNLVSYHDNDGFFERVNVDKTSYMIHFKVVKEVDSIFGYAFNATELIQLQEEIIATQKEIVYTMGEIGETRSKETGNHVKRVAEYSYLLARLKGLDHEEAELLKIASPMHDIGKVGIPDSILKKPGKLDEQEWVTMRTHSQIGYELLKQSKRPILKAAAIVAKEHHEKWDGSGYPQGLKEEKIHIYGRITAIADVFDALGSERVYKKAWELEAILALFKEQSGKHFDPTLVSLFFKHLDEFLAIRAAYQD